MIHEKGDVKSYYHHDKPDVDDGDPGIACHLEACIIQLVLVRHGDYDFVPPHPVKRGKADGQYHIHRFFPVFRF